MSPILILGSGIAGYTLARELRALDPAVPVQVLTADDGRQYSKPMLSAALGKGQTPDQLVMASAGQVAERLAIEVCTGVRVEALDRERHVLRTSAGEIRYGRLVLAVGAHPIRPPMEGDAAGEVLSVNSLDDYQAFRDRLTDEIRHVAIIGPGLIGCEFANDLLGTGRTVTLVGPDPHAISTLLPPAAGQALQTALSSHGARWHLGTVVQAVDRAGEGYRLRLADGSTVEADLVLSAVGLRPDTALAAAAGLATGRGVAVDRTLRSSDPDIYALGDCAEVAGMNLPFVMPIMQGAKALARTLTGQPTEVSYPPMPVVVKTGLHPVAVSPPPRGADGAWREEPVGEGVRARFEAPDGRLLGFALTGPAAAERQALAKQLPPVLA